MALSMMELRVGQAWQCRYKAITLCLQVFSLRETRTRFFLSSSNLMISWVSSNSLVGSCSTDACSQSWIQRSLSFKAAPHDHAVFPARTLHPLGGPLARLSHWREHAFLPVSRRGLETTPAASSEFRLGCLDPLFDLCPIGFKQGCEIQILPVSHFDHSRELV
jgi:hypothetical protein